MQGKWLKTSLADLVDVVGGGTPKTGVLEYWDGNIPWLSIADFKSETRWVSDTEKYITDLGLKNSSTRLLDKGDLIISARGTVGAVAQLSRPMAFNQSCYGLKTKESCYSDFLYYLLQFNFHNIASSAYGAVFDTITRETFNNVFVTVPPHPEQKKIAEILSTWDEAVEKLNSYIEAKKKLKKALMQRLLTGKQRIKESIVREGYKKTELGWIPEDWEVKRLGESCELLKDGTHSSHIDVEPSQGLPLLSAKDINNGKIFFSQESRHISEVDFKQIHKSYFLSDGDILLTIVASIGRVAVVENYERNYTIQRSIAVIRLRKQFYNYFYFYFFQCLYFQKELIQRSNASAQAGVYLGELSKIKIPLPPLLEQKKIAEILSKADEEIDLLNQELEKLKTQKKGLMQKLLTGAWRVKL
jgi:type I restriction enzyme S subunit